MNIDCVISWVDSTNFCFDDKKNIKGYSSENFRFGCRDTLKYVIRGIYENIPWVRNIYLITKSQCPQWLDKEKAMSMNPPIIFVDERDINPNKTYCEGSISVEACMFRIHGLSEFFLYFNDDMFVCKPMQKKEFMHDENTSYLFVGRNIENLSKKGLFWYDNGIIDQINLFKTIYPNSKLKFFESSHMPTVYSKKSYEILNQKLKETLEFTIQSKGRNLNDLIVGRLLAEYISLEEGWSKKREVPTEFFNFDADYRVAKIKKNTTLFCTNINCKLKNDQEKNYHKFMESIFPKKSKCEI